jgi:hypothetical protein
MVSYPQFAHCIKGNIMRTKLLSVLAVLSMAACSQTDSTSNRQGGDTPADYPAGPYGYVQGSIMGDLEFIGKLPPAGATASDSLFHNLDAQPVALHDFRKEEGVKFLYIVGAARWCHPCNDEQPGVRDLIATYGNKGVKLVEILAEGVTQGNPATPDDISVWADLWPDQNTPEGNGGGHGLTSPVVIDPDAGFFQYADVSAYPLGMIVRAENMKIEYICIGEGGGCDFSAAIQSLVE